MKQFKKLSSAAVWRQPLASRQLMRVAVTQIVILILCFGQALSLNLRVNARDAGRPIFSPPKRGSIASRKPKPIFAAHVQAASLSAGQTVTQLPDGRSLLIGGEMDNRAVDTVSISDPRSGEPVQVKTRLHHARAWHSATMLPDGRVLVLGGIGKNGAILKSAEIFDPETQSFALLTVPEIAAQAYHTASLLTDGQVLITGGAGETLLWDFRTKTFRALPAKLSASRQNHKATLLFDGNLLIEGGVDSNGNQIATAELYNTASGSFSFTTISNAQMDQSAPFLAGSLPANGAAEVPIDTFVALRFSKRLRVETLNAHSITLSGTEGALEAKVVPAESGRLAFVTPRVPLLPGMTYTVSVADAVDEGGKTIVPGAVTFTTKGGPEVTLNDGEDWIPHSGNLSGDWRSNRPDSTWQKLPALSASAGITALAGQVLLLNGNPLENVTLQVGTNLTRTDRTGRFLLEGLSSGHHVIKVDGRSASTRAKTYGIFKIGVDIAPGRTNALSFKIWMPRLDTRNAVNVPSPTTRSMTITTPHIPGLEVRIPEGAIVRDVDGQTSTQISITPIPVDRPPFPLPSNVNVPVFFTVQPGAAQVIPPRARVIYPNYTTLPAGSRVDFWNYDPENRGWYIYGYGSVTHDGKQVVPDPGVVIYEFTGFMIGSSGSPAASGPNAGGGPDGSDGDPVDLGTGLFVMEKTDLYLPDTLPILLRRTYRPGDNASRAFGIGSTHPYEMFLWSVNNYQQADLILPDGGRIHYVRISPGTSWSDAIYEHTTTPSVFYKSRLSWNGNGWDLKLNNGLVYVFPDFAPLKSIRDRYGNQINITRSNGNTGNITQLTSPNGRWIQFTYDTSNRVIQARDHIGRIASYTYDTGGRLATATDLNGGVTQYTYDSANRMLTIRDARQIVFLTNSYDTSGRVVQQTQADNSTYQFAYTVDSNGKITQTDVTDPRGKTRRVAFNASGYMISDTRAFGTSEQQSVIYERQAGTNLILSSTDAMNRKTTLTYDAMGNVTNLTRLEDTPQAVSKTMTYEPAFNQLSSVTGPLSHTTAFGYDAKGSLISVTDALNNKSTITYNSAGLPLTFTDASQNTFQFSYDGGDLAGLTNPLGLTNSRFVDSVGRLVSVTNSLGSLTRYQHDSLNQLTRKTDPLQGITEFTYDANGNLSSVTDARGNLTSYTYDNMDRLVTRRNPLLLDETYQYDLNGNRTQVTDHKGQVTTYTYDALNRLTQITYADSSTSAFTYDAGNRLTEVSDSISGNSSYSYDGLNRLLSATTPKGTVTYSYDAAGRRTSMTVTGQPTITYAYDNANRLTGITQGSSTITVEYDAAGRRKSLTLPNGVTAEYTYDAASQLTAITYEKGAVVLGDITYQYDAAGRRAKMGGSFAGTGLPQAFASSTHNVQNQLTQRGTQSFTYDANGNLTSDGTKTYSWNARDQLTSISGDINASFTYDAFGRRISKNIGGSSVDYLYDGQNIVQELGTSGPVANLVTGGLDEIFTRTDTAGMHCFLTAALNSTLGLTDADGVQQTQYVYEPFGMTTVTGAAASNPFQFTSRENDSSGLYYYRARYYSPLVQRFISEDPIGFRSGDTNLYAYVGNDPINMVDPMGLQRHEQRPGGPVPPPHLTPGEIAKGEIVKGIGEAAHSRALPVAGGLGDLAPPLYYYTETLKENRRQMNEICCLRKICDCNEDPNSPDKPDPSDGGHPGAPGTPGSPGRTGNNPGGPGRKN